MFGRYRLCGRLAAGGMAEVWAAQLLGQGGFVKPMVIKRVLPELAENPTFLKMLMTEARVAARLSHANVCSVFELGQVGGEYYIAMEYLRGASLSSILRDGGRIPPAIAVSLIAQACEGLHYAHEQRDTGGNLLGLVHRDVSPHNLFVTVEGILKVLDFGIAKVDDGISERTEEGKVKGKLTYMSPEQLAAMPLDRRSDVWSLAVVLWEMLAGRRLFGGGGPAAAVDGIRNARVPGLATVGVVAPRLDAVLMRAMTAERDDRIATAGELRKALIEAMAPSTMAPAEDITQLVWERCLLEVRANDRRFENDEGSNESEVVDRLPLRAEETQPLLASPDRHPVPGQDEPRRRPSTAATAADRGPGLRSPSVTAASIDTSPEIEIEHGHHSATGVIDAASEPAVLAVGMRAQPARGPWLVAGLLCVAAMSGAVAVKITERRPLAAPSGSPDRGSSAGGGVVDVAPVVVAIAPPVGADTETGSAAGADPGPAAGTDPGPAAGTGPASASGPRTVRPVRDRPPRVAVAKPGRLTVDADPWATIYLDGKKLGVTPIIGLSVPSGGHLLKAVAADGKTRTLRVEVAPGATLRRKVTW